MQLCNVPVECSKLQHVLRLHNQSFKEICYLYIGNDRKQHIRPTSMLWEFNKDYSIWDPERKGRSGNKKCPWKNVHRFWKNFRIAIFYCRLEHFLVTWTGIYCTHFVSMSLENMSSLQKWLVLGTVSHRPVISYVLTHWEMFLISSVQVILHKAYVSLLIGQYKNNGSVLHVDNFFLFIHRLYTARTLLLMIWFARNKKCLS